jgi:hypothetical protein
VNEVLGGTLSLGPREAAVVSRHVERLAVPARRANQDKM